MSQTVLPYSRGVAVTLHDTNVQECVAFMVGDTSGGDTLVVNFKDDPTTDITLTGLIEGALYPLNIYRFKSTSSTVASVVRFPG